MTLTFPGTLPEIQKLQTLKMRRRQPCILDNALHNEEACSCGDACEKDSNEWQSAVNIRSTGDWWCTSGASCTSASWCIFGGHIWSNHGPLTRFPPFGRSHC
ncbi:hypothetical protein HN011_001032 [Eciton burchellii]|nr:hypothetical protein HN011_001032 [Eciton burchellii]